MENWKQAKIVKERPPKWLWDEAHATFEIEDHETIYTYGDTIYDTRTAEYPLSASVIVHEMTHMRQQREIEGGPDKWWIKYFMDPQFRKLQEIEAYRAQYKHACTVYKDRNDQARYLNIIATHLSSPMYKIDMSLGEALKAIRN